MAFEVKTDENFIQNKYGYCFFTLTEPHIVYNLYIHSAYRQNGHAKKLLGLVIGCIRDLGYQGNIEIEAKPKDNSIPLHKLIGLYESVGLVVKNNPRKANVRKHYDVLYVSVECPKCGHGGGHPLFSYRPKCHVCKEDVLMQPCGSNDTGIVCTWEDLVEYEKGRK